MKRLLLAKRLKQFRWDRLWRVGGEAHEGKIGEWIRWWVDGKPNYMVINPPPKDRKTRRCADVLFLEESPITKAFQALGIAEIENSEKKWIEKLITLKAYEEDKARYPDLRFALLCVSWYEHLKEKMDPKLVEAAKKMAELSKNSRIDWILYILKYAKLEREEAPFRIRIPDYVQGYEFFYYTYRNLKGAEWLMFRKGKILDNKAYEWRK